MNHEQFLSRAAARMTQSAIRKMGTLLAGGRDIISFAPGYPAPDTFAWDEFRAIAAELLGSRDGTVLQYGPTRGYRPLLESILGVLDTRGIKADLREVMTTSGSQQGLDLTARVLIAPGDVVLVEVPTYTGAIAAFRNAQCRLVGVRQDADGINLEDLDATLMRERAAGARVNLLYLVPNFQNPTGVTTTLERRRRIVELAHQYGMLIVEDDAYFDLRYEGEALPTIYSLDPNGRTLYLGTLSKTLAAGFRIGWAVGPAPIIRRIASLKTDGGTNIFGSFIAASWLPEHFEGHVAELRRIYGQRRDLMLAALEKYMPAGATWSVPTGGFFVWLTLPEGVDSGPMLAQAREMGIEYLPGTACFFDHTGANHIRLSFSFARDEVIDEGIRRLGELIRSEWAESISG